MRLHFIFFFALTLTWGSCKNKAGEAEAGTKGEFAPAEATIDLGVPPLTSEDVNDLYAKSEKVDIIFYDLPISVSQEDDASVKNTVKYVVPAAPVVTAKCKALGRLAWIANAAIYREADVYVGTGCNYLVFMQNNQAVAANALAPEGVQFFTNIVSQVNQKAHELQSSGNH